MTRDGRRGPRKPTPSVTIETFAAQQTSALLRQLAFLLGRAAQSGDAASIVDLYTVILRFESCLLVFLQFYPAAEVQRIQRRLRKLARLSEQVQHHDIALALLAKLRVREESPVSNSLAQERKRALRQLREFVDKWRRRDLSKRWRVRLGL